FDANIVTAHVETVAAHCELESILEVRINPARTEDRTIFAQYDLDGSEFEIDKRADHIRHDLVGDTIRRYGYVHC
ncbi:MAG: hypothetical protein AAF394_16920, partial [Planctomycetota bacterium]